MKKLVTILSFAAIIASCTGKASKTEPAEESKSTVELKDTTVVDSVAMAEMTIDSTAIQDSVVAVIQETDSVSGDL